MNVLHQWQKVIIEGPCGDQKSFFVETLSQHFLMATNNPPPCFVRLPRHHVLLSSSAMSLSKFSFVVIEEAGVVDTT
jgi:hypothetical protein